METQDKSDKMHTSLKMDHVIAVAKKKISGAVKDIFGKIISSSKVYFLVKIQFMDYKYVN